jgi:hypothetical protein
MYSPALLQLRADGWVPDIATIEIKDFAEEGAFFRINVTPEEAAALPVVDGRIPWDVESMKLTRQFPYMCGRCFEEQRQALTRR